MTHKPGDKVEVETVDGTQVGIIMPNENANILFLKLTSGYNVGIDKKKIKTIDILEPFKETKKESKETIKENKKLPTISILHTGGTIASKVDYRTGGVISKFSPDDLLAMFPELHEIANIKSKQIFQMFSEDMEPIHWSKIAEAVKEEIGSGVDGVIVTHGTDTLMYSSAALSFMLQDSPIPVVYVAAQRSSDRASSDAGENIIGAFKFIVNSDYAGVAVCMHKNENDGICLIHSGVNVKKMHTSRRDTFRSVNQVPIAEIDVKTGKINYLRKDYLKKDKKRKLIFKNKIEEKVAIVKIRPGFNFKELEFYEKNGYKGLVLEGTGLGNAPVNVLDENTKHHADLLKTLKRMSEKMVIVMTSQAFYGGLNMNVYSSGRDLLSAGVISGESMMTEVAYSKLVWVLGHHDINSAKKEMSSNLVGEMPERVEKNTFLI